jgi:hypothetical protein
MHVFGRCDRSLRGLLSCGIGFLVDVLVAWVVIAWVREGHIEVLKDGEGYKNQKEWMIVV